MRPGPVLGLLLALVGAAPAAAALTVRQGVVYGRGRIDAPAPGSVPLRLDLYRPARPAAAPRPVVVLIHGGGFARQSRTDHNVVRLGRGFAHRGYVAAAIDYRLVGSDPQPSQLVRPLLGGLAGEGPGPRAVVAAVDDTLTAIRYLRAHAGGLGIDMHRLGLVGSSAGAITADHVAYALDDYGIAPPRVRFVGDLWGGLLVKAPDGAAESAFQLGRGEAALFSVHGTADTTVPVRLDDELNARARAEHVRDEYHRIPGATHGYPGTGFFTRPLGGGETAYRRLLRFAAANDR